MKNILKCGCVFLMMISVFLVLLVLTSLIPAENIRDKVIESSELLSQEGNRKIVNIPMKGLMRFDNYTDALMINTAYSIDSSKPLNSSLMARKNYIPDVTEHIYEDVSGELKSSMKYGPHYDPAGELRDTVNGEATESFEYARYWHGYLCIFRPLLLIFNLKQIRNIITIILIILAILLLKDIYKKLGVFYVMIFLLGFLGIDYIYFKESIQGCLVFLITMIFMNILIGKNANIKNIPMCFLIIGMITNFVDFLTTPVITLGMPLILIFLFQQKEEKLEFREIIKIFVEASIPWVIGYGLTWVSKWILVDIIYNRELIKTGITQVLYRTKGAGGISLELTWATNLIFILLPLTIEIMICTGIIVWGVIKNKKRLTYKERCVGALPYILIGMMPYIWYTVLLNHSANHIIFTYRNQILTLIALPIAAYKFFNIENN